MNKIAVVGLGYVGLPLALLAEEKKFAVIGIDSNKDRLKKLAERKSVIDDEQASKRLKSSKITFTSDFSLLKDRDIVLICVPTPVDKNKIPDLSLVKEAALNAAVNMKEDSLLIIESTINPGVCDEILTPLIDARTSHTVGKSFHLAHCPERINPGDPKWTVDNINRVVGASDDRGLEAAYKFYSKLIDAKVKKMGSLKEAEAVKIVENTFRDINIAFVNELAMSFTNLGINVMNVIDGAATKPFAFLPHYPGIGIGGHCIPVDPYYLIEYARGNGFEHEFLTLARSINESMPEYAVEALEKTYMEKVKKSLKNTRVIVLGISYKPNIGDDRESPAYQVIDSLKDKGAEVHTYDPYMLEKSSLKDLGGSLNSYDIAVLVTAHDKFKNFSPDDFMGVKLVYDGRNIYSGFKEELEKLGVSYMSIAG